MSCFSSDHHEIYHGSTDIRLFSRISWKVDFEKYSSCHRTMTAHFLNKGKWDDSRLEDILKSTIIQIIYEEALRSVLWMIPSPSSKAFVMGSVSDWRCVFPPVPPQGKQDYGHQAVAAMFSCNRIVLNYVIVMYDKSRSKVKIVQDIAEELPVPPVVSYFFCDSWYTCSGIMDAFIKKRFYTIGVLKTNWVLYLCGIRQKACEFALHLRKADAAVSLVTSGSWVIMSAVMKGVSIALKMP